MLIDSMSPVWGPRHNDDLSSISVWSICHVEPVPPRSSTSNSAVAFESQQLSANGHRNQDILMGLGPLVEFVTCSLARLHGGT
jgi:hypothetical protein